MADSGDDFLKRWSRRKRGLEPERAAEVAEAGPADLPPPADAGGDVALTEEEEARRKALVEQLPDIETLDESSDFTAFLQEGVPEELKRRALRRLWRLNPVFANLDGLNDYDEDFTDAAMVVKGLKTIYQVGKGMVVPEEEPAPDEPAVAETEVEAEAEAAAREGERPEVADDPDPAAATEAQAAALPDAGSETGAAKPPAARRPSESQRRPKVPAARRRWTRFET